MKVNIVLRVNDPSKDTIIDLTNSKNVTVEYWGKEGEPEYSPQFGRPLLALCNPEETATWGVPQ